MTAFPNLIPPAWSAAMTFSGLNSLANANSVLSTTVIDNGADLKRYDTIYLAIVLGSITPTGTPPLVSAALIPEFDSNYPSHPTGSTLPMIGAAYPFDYQQVTTSASAKNVNLVLFNAQPVNYKVLIINQTGVSFAGSGNSVKWSGTLRETR